MKRISLYLAAVLLLCLLCAPASAAAPTESGLTWIQTDIVTNIKTADGQAVTPVDTDEFGSYYPKAERFTVTCPGTTEGNQYLVVMTLGNETPSDDNIVYIDQKEATGNSVSFDVFPSELQDGVYYIFVTGEGMAWNADVPLTTIRSVVVGPQQLVTGIDADGRYFYNGSWVGAGYTGLYYDGTDYYYIWQGIWVGKDYTGLYDAGGGNYYWIANGKLAPQNTAFTGIADDGRYMVNDVHQASYSGLVNYNGYDYYVWQGYWVGSGYTGLYYDGTNYYYIWQGIWVGTGYTGLYDAGGGNYYWVDHGILANQ